MNLTTKQSSRSMHKKKLKEIRLKKLANKLKANIFKRKKIKK